MIKLNIYILERIGLQDFGWTRLKIDAIYHPNTSCTTMSNATFSFYGLMDAKYPMIRWRVLLEVPFGYAVCILQQDCAKKIPLGLLDGPRFKHVFQKFINLNCLWLININASSFLLYATAIKCLKLIFSWLWTQMRQIISIKNKNLWNTCGKQQSTLLRCFESKSYCRLDWYVGYTRCKSEPFDATEDKTSVIWI